MFRWMLQGQVLDRRQRQQATSSASESQARAQEVQTRATTAIFLEDKPTLFLVVSTCSAHVDCSRGIFLSIKKLCYLKDRQISITYSTQHRNIDQRHHNGRPLGLGSIPLLCRLNTVRSRQRRTILLPKVHMNVLANPTQPHP